VALVAVAAVAVAAVACGSEAAPTATPTSIEIVDDAGRSVSVPAGVDAVLGTDPVGTTILYTLAPDRLAGWNYTLTETEKAFIPDEYGQLPDLGGWYGKSMTGSVEEILRHDIDVLVMMIGVDEAAIAQAERIEEATRIPVVILDSGLTELEHAYEVLGRALGEEERAATLGAYCREAVDAVAGRAAEIPEAERTTVYYAEGLEGLETDPEGSLHTEVLSLSGGRNVADVQAAPGGSRAAVSLEQVLAWDPQLVLVGSNPGADADSYATIRTTKRWGALGAVERGEVYEAPHGPFDWFDRPYSVNRVIGLQWLANLLYPKVFTYDIRERTRQFYELFYHVDVTDEQLDWLLRRGTRDVDGLTPQPLPTSSPSPS
jgi:iron complex transport system substrate-binding protein